MNVFDIREYLSSTHPIFHGAYIIKDTKSNSCDINIITSQFICVLSKIRIRLKYLNPMGKAALFEL